MEKKPDIILSSKEKSYYDYIFNVYAKNDDTDGEKYLSKEVVTNLLKKSKLSKEILADIWKKMEIKPQTQKVTLLQLYKGLKLVSISQNSSMDGSTNTEMPLPQFEEQPLQSFRNEIEKESVYYLRAYIISSDYVKSGFLGVQSHVMYTVETKSNLAGYTRKNVFTVRRRYNDFIHLSERIFSTYKGCPLPKLPDKKFLMNTDIQFVEKRKESLQLYLNILCKNTIINTDEALRDFLTLEDCEEYQRTKTEPVSLLKQITQIKFKPSNITDNINFLYYTVSNKMNKKQEPKELEVCYHHQMKVNLEEIINKIDIHLPLIAIVEGVFKNAYLDEQMRQKEIPKITEFLDKWENDEKKENKKFIANSKILLQGITKVVDSYLGK